MTTVVLFLLASPVAVQDYTQANAFFEQQKYGAASEALNRALKEDPNYVPAWTLRGKMAMAFNRFDIARAAFTRAVTLDPGSAYVQFMLGFFYYFDNDFTNAIPPLETAARLNQNDPRPLLYLAMSQDGLAHPDSALALYQKTIELETRVGKPDPETHTAYGRLLSVLGRYEESGRQVARVLELDPESRDGHYELGRLDFQKGDYAGAAAEGEKALAKRGPGTTDRQIHFLLTRAYSRIGKKELANLHRKLFEASPPTLRR
ncbi:MAG: tetratricopeptide repeat protein [Bryobacteraceae bacterium]